MLTLALVALLGAGHDAGHADAGLSDAELRKGPPPSELAKLYFLAGDLRRAIDTAKMGAKVEPVKCKALYPMLVEYEFLAQRSDRLTPAEAKALLEWDRKISPGTPAKLTAGVFRQHVSAPLQTARVALEGHDLKRAKKFVEQALEVDPANVEALALSQELAASDAGR